MPVRNVRRRYLALQVHSEADITQAELSRAISDEIHLLYGVRGAAETDYRMIEYNQQPRQGIIRCNHDRLTETRAALAHITAIDDAPVAIQVVTVSGTIKTLRKRLEESTSETV
jgi:ribonuclease P/MRP protein subunit POP5